MIAWLARKPVVRLLAVGWGLCLLGLTAVGVQGRVPVGYLVRDPAATTESAWYTGAVSYAGILGWWTAATVLGLGALLFRWLGWPADIRFLAIGAALSAVLGLDDLLMLHEDVVPRMLGVSEKAVVGVVGVAAVVWLVLHRDSVVPASVLPLGAAAVCFALSAAVDLALEEEDAGWRLLLEEGAKLFGIVAWVAFTLVTVRVRVREAALRSEGPGVRIPA